MTPTQLETSFADTLREIGLMPTDTLALAISGGADSMALLHLAKSYTDKLIALTVDHGLRPESRGEAEQVAQWCKDFGVEHHILTWQGDKPKARIQREARRARYSLMSAFCKEHGIHTLLTAHHKNDQIETFFLRLLKGSGLRGLAGMPVVKVMESLNLIRPLLAHDKETLVAYLNEKNQPFMNDPSNENLNFGRVKVRQWLASAKTYDLSFEEVTHTMVQAQELRHFLDEQVAALAKECLSPLLYTPPLSSSGLTRGSSTDKDLRIKSEVDTLREATAQHTILLPPFLAAPPYIRKEFLRTYITEHSSKDFPPRFETIEHLHTAILEGRTTTAGGFIWRMGKEQIDITLESR